MTTLKRLPERAHHVFIDAGGDTFDDMMSLLDHFVEGVREGTLSLVTGGYSSGGFFVYRQSAITHDEYMAAIDQRKSGEYRMRSDDELMADAELEALRAENARLRADLADAHRHIDEAGRAAAAEHAEAERLREALAAAPRWVSVTERLPRPREAEDFFIARLENGTRVEAMHNGTSWWEFDHELEDWIPLVGVTHWYQVPAPQKQP